MSKLSGIFKRFVDSLRGLFSSQGNKDPFSNISNIEPSAFSDSLEHDEDMYHLDTNAEIEQEVET